LAYFTASSMPMILFHITCFYYFLKIDVTNM
jgi:hypothetical protein